MYSYLTLTYFGDVEDSQATSSGYRLCPLLADFAGLINHEFCDVRILVPMSPVHQSKSAIRLAAFALPQLLQANHVCTLSHTIHF